MRERVDGSRPHTPSRLDRCEALLATAAALALGELARDGGDLSDEASDAAKAAARARRGEDALVVLDR